MIFPFQFTLNDVFSLENDLEQDLSGLLDNAIIQFNPFVQKRMTMTMAMQWLRIVLDHFALDHFSMRHRFSQSET